MPPLPKPLSEKSINRMLSKWKPEIADVLHDFFRQCSNLYGAIELYDAWDIFKVFHKGIRKKDFMEFSSVARREDLPYYVLEVDEIYPDDPRRIEDRFIVNKELVNWGFNRFVMLQRLYNKQCYKPFYVPEDLSKFSAGDGVQVNPAWVKFCDLIGSFKSPDGVPISEYKHISEHDEFNLELEKAAWAKQRLMDQFDRPLADRLLDRTRIFMHIGYENAFKYLAEQLEEHEIYPTEEEAIRMMELFMKANNTSNLWVNRGWAPLNMARPKIDPNDPDIDIVIHFDEGVKAAIARGELDASEIEKKLDELGLKYEWD